MVSLSEAIQSLSTNILVTSKKNTTAIRNSKSLEIKIKNAEECSYEELQKLNKSKNKFISIVSHELRTPMTVINGFTEFLLSEKFGDLNPKQREFLGTISRNTTTLIQLVNKMLDISRLESGNVIFESRDILLPEFLTEATKEFQVFCAQKNIALSFQNPKNLHLFIKSDPFRIKRILTNLISNARKCTPSGGSIAIILEPCRIKGQSVQISVKDNGIGISKKDLKSIFKKFHQIENSLRKTYTGTGLGLHIVKLIVERLGGTISAKSTEGKGACFTFSLPDCHDA
jgi:signal transduction histidine kinase